MQACSSNNITLLESQHATHRILEQRHHAEKVVYQKFQGQGVKKESCLDEFLLVAAPTDSISQQHYIKTEKNNKLKQFNSHLIVPGALRNVRCGGRSLKYLQVNIAR